MGYILQAPVSDREYMDKNLPHFQTTVELAISLKEQDKGSELLPRSAYPDVPITVDRFLSLAIKGGGDDVFSTDLTDQEIRTLYQNIHRPICWVYSEKDECYTSSTDPKEVMTRYQSLCDAIQMVTIVPNGDHLITHLDAQSYFCSLVKDFIQSL